MHRPARHTFRKTARIPSPSATSLPQKYFVSQEVFAKEQSKIFSKEWLLVGHQSQVAKPGDYFVIEASGESLIVIRDSKFEIRNRKSEKNMGCRRITSSLRRGSSRRRTFLRLIMAYAEYRGSRSGGV